jgi:hypothetical protein
MTEPSGESHEFPVFRPVDVRWFGPASEPIIGPRAEADIKAIRKKRPILEHRILGRRLVQKIKRLLDSPVSITGVLVPDPPGVGPRYACDLDDGYAAVCWVLEPPAGMTAAGPAVWVEQVVLWSTLEEAL